MLFLFFSRVVFASLLPCKPLLRLPHPFPLLVPPQPQPYAPPLCPFPRLYLFICLPHPPLLVHLVHHRPMRPPSAAVLLAQPIQPSLSELFMNPSQL
ncbi:uncharacterized protein BDZ99DRAFT_268216 [Mytilinidion resinicola]|uniref:Uncharacterized protein n=1 Tax=Mytilinidion resinicola TaxID=574789 RepID=A0A6A6YX67_9PEZI|nr:uncharacterized protein BDZ99DRAFT_268216 [Mytilinidion resinicola]KAF2812507.1 hypothetical protein BDZ99DRAFT_268216 [Mytilinidion resinicola]